MGKGTEGDGGDGGLTRSRCAIGWSRVSSSGSRFLVLERVEGVASLLLVVEMEHVALMGARCVIRGPASWDASACCIGGSLVAGGGTSYARGFWEVVSGTNTKRS